MQNEKLVLRSLGVAGLSYALKKIVLCAFMILCVFCATAVRDCHAAAIIVDHTCTDLTKIPDSAIANATTERIAVRWCSIFLDAFFRNATGVAALEAENSKYNDSKIYGIN